MPKLKRVVIAASATVLAAVAAAAAVSVPVSGESRQSGQSAPESAAWSAEVHPDFFRIPWAARSAPPTTAQCEQYIHVACYSPNQIRAAYRLPALYARRITGRGVTIVIEDSYGSPSIRQDLTAFDRQYGYPAPPRFSVIQPVGRVAKFNPRNPNMAGWQYETSLDVEYAHAIAPGASIVLVETPATGGGSDERTVMLAEEYVANHHLGAMISESFSGTEVGYSYAGLQQLRGGILDDARHHVTILASSGDAGATTEANSGSGFYARREVNWQASDPLVTGVGGTRLIESGSRYTSVAWNDTYNPVVNRDWFNSSRSHPFASGGGQSAIFPRPSYQNGVRSLTGGRRGVPDIAMSAACNGSVLVYSSYQPGAANQAGWSQACGTSEAAPEFAGIVALADQVAGRWLGPINPTLYRLLAHHASGLINVTSGDNTVSFYGANNRRYTVNGYHARRGYSLVTGVGTINASLFVYELAGKRP